MIDDKKPVFDKEFYSKIKCDRCGGELGARIMSWFTRETICMKCSADEEEIKKKLRESGKNPLDYEDCGYIPKV